MLHKNSKFWRRIFLLEKCMVINDFMKNVFSTIMVITKKTRFFRCKTFLKFGKWTFINVQNGIFKKSFRIKKRFFSYDPKIVIFDGCIGEIEKYCIDLINGIFAYVYGASNYVYFLLLRLVDVLLKRNGLM